LRRWQVRQLIEADHHARQIGVALVTFGTIRWALTEGGQHDVAGRTTRLWKAITAWARRHGFPLAYVYVHENPERAGGGLNTHFLASVPAVLRSSLQERITAHLCASDGAILIEQRRQPGRTDTRLNYMLKGTDKATAIKFGLISPSKGWDYAQGHIPFKRAGTSANIGRKVRPRSK
jgi:hypothetical protein